MKRRFRARYDVFDRHFTVSTLDGERETYIPATQMRLIGYKPRLDDKVRTVALEFSSAPFPGGVKVNATPNMHVADVRVKGTRRYGCVCIDFLRSLGVPIEMYGPRVAFYVRATGPRS